MKINEYQFRSKQTAIHLSKEYCYIFTLLGLYGKSGEIAQEVMKLLRDNDRIISEKKKEKLIDDMGDILWYLSNLASDLNVDLELVAERNLNKVHKRLQKKSNLKSPYNI